jgi:hypothetical protein
MAANNDIVLGVTSAVDASKHRAAVSRLEKLSGEAPTTEAAASQPEDPTLAWTAEIQRAAAATSHPAKFVASAAPTDGSSKKNSAYVQFEALLLQNMIEAMMPEHAEAVFGSGTAGNVWKSMLAEKVAAEIARAGPLGIAKEIAAAEKISAGAVSPTKMKAGDA